MKNKITFYLSLAFILLNNIINAQAPPLINYQGVARNGSEILVDKTIELQFTVHDLTTEGPPLYSETQSTTTNSYGIFLLKIGNGTVVSGNFNTINWGINTKYLEIDIDTTNTGNFQLLATSQLLSVPYALYANRADTASYASNAPQAIYTAGKGISLNGNVINADTTSLSSTPSGDSLIVAQGSHVVGYVGLSLLVPPGTMQAYGGTTAPAGWLLCDGGSYAINGPYSTLYNVISFNFGGSGNNFNVPDLRGMFLRGVDPRTAGGNDPDNSSRTALSINGNAGAKVGSLQKCQIQSHSHLMDVALYQGGSSGPAPAPGCGSCSGLQGTPTETTGGAETRPINVYVNYIIKY